MTERIYHEILCPSFDEGGLCNCQPVIVVDAAFAAKERVMAVRAKVTCEGIAGNTVTFRTVYEPDAAKDTENARFTKATPWGTIQLGIDNPAALEQFTAGKSYYVDFIEAD